jgi:hypothetical protein
MDCGLLRWRDVGEPCIVRVGSFDMSVDLFNAGSCLGLGGHQIEAQKTPIAPAASFSTMPRDTFHPERKK